MVIAWRGYSIYEWAGGAAHAVAKSRDALREVVKDWGEPARELDLEKRNWTDPSVYDYPDSVREEGPDFTGIELIDWLLGHESNGPVLALYQY